MSTGQKNTCSTSIVFPRKVIRSRVVFRKTQYIFEYISRYIITVLSQFWTFIMQTIKRLSLNRRVIFVKTSISISTLIIFYHNDFFFNMRYLHQIMILEGVCYTEYWIFCTRIFYKEWSYRHSSSFVHALLISLQLQTDTKTIPIAIGIF